MNRLQRSAAAGVAVAIAVFTAGASLAFVSADRTEENVLICHRTASEANPYNLIPVNPNGYDGHDQHPGDLIPAPGGTCPSQPPTPTPTPTPTETPTPTPTPTPTETVTPASPATPEPIEPVDADETALVEPAEPVIQPDEDTAVEPASASRVPISVPAGGGAASGDQ
jgi:outer membrane biosynthesis protein TonB